jgi:hypothetical protein
MPTSTFAKAHKVIHRTRLELHRPCRCFAVLWLAWLGGCGIARVQDHDCLGMQRLLENYQTVPLKQPMLNTGACYFVCVLHVAAAVSNTTY